MRLSRTATLIISLIFSLIPALLRAEDALEKEAIEAAAAKIYAEAQAQEQEGEYSDAADLYEDLVDDFPGSVLVPDALFHLAVCQEKTDDFYDAFLTYQRILDDYPGKGSLNEILQRQFVIGESFLGGRQRLLLFFRIRSGLSTAEEIFSTMVKTAPFSRIAPAAQFNLAKTIQTDGRYREAEVEYDHLLETYAGSEVVPEALFQKIVCIYEVSRGPDYEQGDTIRGLKLLEFYQDRYPESTHRDVVAEMTADLRQRLAERDYDIGRYYERKGDSIGAITYYQAVISKYPGNPWEKEALARIEALQPLAEKELILRQEMMNAEGTE